MTDDDARGEHVIEIEPAQKRGVLAGEAFRWVCSCGHQGMPNDLPGAARSGRDHLRDVQ